MVATGVGILGGIIALFWRQSLSIRSAVQHFPAGAVLAAIAANVVPEVERMGTFAGIPGRFIAGGPAMIGLKWVGVTFEHGKKKGNAFHWAWLPRLQSTHFSTGQSRVQGSERIRLVHISACGTLR